MRLHRASSCALVGIAVGLALACKTTSSFACISSEECGVGGLCEDNGQCSFADVDCPTGRRWGHLAAGDLADQCVEPNGGTGASSGGAAAHGASSSSEGTADDTTDDTTDTPAVCPSGDGPPGQCSPDPPAGWSGPLLALQASSRTIADVPCPPSVPNETGLYFDGLHGAPAQCGCTCAAQFTCDDATLRPTGTLGCAPSPAGGSTSLRAEACTPLGASFGGGWIVSLDGPGFGECAPNLETILPDATWDLGVRLCRADTTAACHNGTCLPPPPPGLDAGICITRPGTHACPLSGYTQARTVYGGVDDTRECTACECGTIFGETLGVCTFELYDSDDCGGEPTTASGPPQDSWCISNAQGNGGQGAIVIRPDCGEVQVSTPTGALAASEPMSMCCLP